MQTRNTTRAVTEGARGNWSIIMEITKQQTGEMLEIRIEGRLDAYWADHLTAGLSDVIREGARQISLDMSEITYISSAGIRVLLQFYKQLKGIQGSFVVSRPSEQVKMVLELAGFKDLLVQEAAPQAEPISRPSGASQLTLKNMLIEVFDGTPGASLKCRIVGNADLLPEHRFRKEHTRAVSFPDSVFAVGVGAPGNAFEDCCGRFGEFLAVGGAAAYLPTGGTNVPDYLVSSGSFVPELKTLYCLACEGAFAKMMQFEAKKDAGAITLTKIVDACLEVAQADTIGMVMVAESAGLMGAALRQSPALHTSGASLFEHPGIQEWLSFSAERAYARSLTLIAGVAVNAERKTLASMVRPIGKCPLPAGHFHAAVFSYRPLKKGEMDMKTTVSTLFESETLQAVLHLLNDDREIAGAGQSEFIRGACWIGPITEITGERE